MDLDASVIVLLKQRLRQHDGFADLPGHTKWAWPAGHGLDWVWPFLLGYPQDKIAVIDDVCVIHPKKMLQREGKTSMYDTNPHFLGWQTEEEKIQFEKYGYAAKASRTNLDY